MLDLDALVLLDVEGGERFVLTSDHTSDLVPARDLPWEQVALCLEDPVEFVRTVAGGRSLPMQQVRRLQASWAAQNGLVDGAELARLVWTVRHFQREIEFDLRRHLQVSLGELWRERRWRELLNLLDRLPRATWTHQSMVNHPEYAARLAEGMAKRAGADDGEEWSHPLVEFTPEVGMLAGVIDAVNALRSTLIRVNMEKGKEPPKIPPYPRPRTLADTMVESARKRLRWTAHDQLVSRLLPNRHT